MKALCEIAFLGTESSLNMEGDGKLPAVLEGLFPVTEQITCSLPAVSLFSDIIIEFSS